MNREQSQILKGVAILLMIFYHLFNLPWNVTICNNLIFIGGTPIVEILSNASNPVSFYLILGGYGMYKVYRKGDTHRWSRIFKLYLHYWIILLIFMTIGAIFSHRGYFSSLNLIIANVTGFHTSFNGEMWFLLPYIILCLISPWLFRLIRNLEWWKVIGITLFIHLCTSFCISRYGQRYLFNNYWIYNPLLVFHLMFSFFLGAIAARNDFFEWLSKKTKALRHRSLTGGIAIVFFVIVKCIFKYLYGYEFLVIAAIRIIALPVWLNKILGALGKRSMDMWMIHTWFCYYLFHDFIYGFRYPLVIFLVLTIITYCSSVIVNWLCLPVERLLLTRNELKEKPLL